MNFTIHVSGWTRRATRTVLIASWLVALCIGSPNQVWTANLPPGFAETVIPGPGGQWTEAVGITFENNGRMYVWGRTGKLWFKDPADPSPNLLLDISEEVGAWNDYGFLGFAVDPNFRQNGYIYLLYVVDRHHLLHYGTPSYNPNTDEFNAATIGRLTRYTCRASDGFRSVDPASRLVLIGQTKQTGFPMCSDTHGIGSLVFGTDDTLLISCGDGASAWTSDTGGAAFGSTAPQALADGILRPKEDIGAFRAQLVDCLNGKVVRIDPATGNGLPSNPFYDPANPSSPRSRVWALGLRNPFRMTLRPNTGSHNPDDGDPGVLYVGNVGWDTWECLKVVTAKGQNFGWPLWEGLDIMALYDVTVRNLDAPNPVYPAGGCNQYFSFKDLIKEDTLAPAGAPPFVNPCNTALRIPTSIPQFLHTRPALDWNHANAIARTPTYGGAGQAQIANVGANGSPVTGSQFQGNCSVGGTWYTGSLFPLQYQNTYFHADWGAGWIKSMSFDQNDKPYAVTDFLTAGGNIVAVTQHPTDESLYYIGYDYGDPGTIRKISYLGNRTPEAVASADKFYGASPLTVQFTSSGSSDPDNQPLSFSWNFGDGTATSTQPNPSHTFSAPGGVPTKFVVTLTVTDPGGLSSQASLVVSANNTPPVVTITSPIDGGFYPPTVPSTNALTAVVSDAESADSLLRYEWQTILHHNDHNHGSPIVTNHTTTAVLSPTGCDGINIYYYRFVLTVTDPAGLSTRSEVRLFPNCGSNAPPTISDIPNLAVFQDRSTAPIPFTVWDGEVAVNNLQLSAVSANPSLVPVGNIVFGGSGSNRTVTVMPAPGQTGTATITVSVTDGPSVASDTFVLTVNPAPPVTASFTNSAPFNIPDGVASPYPSYIAASGLGGTVSQVTVTIAGINHQWSSDMDILLVSPTGHGVLLISDVGNGTVNNATVTLSDQAAAQFPGSSAIASGTFKPTDFAPADTFPAPAPGGPYGTTMSAFNQTNPNGAWALYVFDDGNNDVGSISGGWRLTITTSAVGGQPPTISNIPDQTTSANTPTAAIPFTVADPNTPLNNLTLSGSSSNPTLVPNANIVFSGTGGNRNVTITPASGQIGTATITVTVSDGSSIASAGFVLTVTGVNTAPTISTLSDQAVNEDTLIGPISITVGDAESAPGTLVLTGSSSDTVLVPNANILFGGSGSARTVSILSATNRSGSATITITVSDQQLSASNSFVVTVNSINDAPAISTIANQTIERDTVAGPISFTVSDAETAAASLSVSAFSSNTGLVPNGNIVPGGSGGARNVTVTPLAGLVGSATITLTVTDGSQSNSTSFLLTVTPPNTAPTISVLPDQTVAEDTATGTLGFTVGDFETAATSLAVSATSSDLSVVPISGIVLGGSGSNRTVRVTPAANQSGTSLITLIVNDGQTNASSSFLLTVTPVNDVPAISSIADRTISFGTSTGPIGFTIGDVETAAGSLTLQGSSSNQTLVPNGNIVFGGSGSNRTVTVTPISTQTGTALITVIVSDGTATNTTSFTLTVSSLLTGTVSYTNATAIVIPDSGPSPTYPSLIVVSNRGGTISNLTVSLRGLSHTWTRDMEVLLVAPSGQAILLMSDAGNGTVNNITLTFSAAAASDIPLTPLATATYRPADYEPGDVLAAPAPAGPYASLLSAFNGLNANGAWSLYVFDDGPGDQGSIAGGWSISITTVGAAGAAPTITDIGDQSIPQNTATAALPFTIGDADTAVSSLVVTGASSNTGLVPNANIVFGGSGSNRTVIVTPVTGQTGASTITVTVSDGTSAASDSFLLMVNTVNTAPTISGPTDQTINEDTPLGPLAVTIGDAESNAASLTLQRSSSNQTLVPDANIVLGGSGSNRTVTITPAGNQNGTATIRLVVSDGQLSTTNSFLLTVTPVNDAPVISSIANQTIDQDTSTGPLSFTIGDVETAAGSLTLTGNSSNPTLVPGGNIVFGGSGSSRTVTVTPVAGQVGNTTITLTVDDGSLSNSTAFVVTVTASNTPPTISAVADQTINEDTSTALLAFTVGDADTAAGSLVVTATSSTLSVIPASGISLGGSGSNRTVQLTPATNQNGTATITLSVSDGRFSTSNSFLVTVTPVNDVPVISSISDRSVSSGTSTGPISFIIGDVETAAASLTLQGSSSNQTLVPNGNIVFGGSGSNRTVTVTPAASQSGSTTIAVAVSDGSATNTTSFTLTVSSLLTGTVSYTNATAIVIPDSGPSPTYPSLIVVSNRGGTISNLTVSLRGLSHTWTRDMEVLLVAPSGQAILLMSDAGNGTVNNITLTFSAAAASDIPLTPLATATYRPADYEPGDVLAAPAPAGPYASLLSAFNGLNANGAWSLYVFDDGPGDQGSIAGGWSISITTVGAAGAAPTITDIGDQSIPQNTATAALPFTIGDADTAVSSLVVTGASSNTGLVPNANIVFGGSGSNRTVIVTPVTGQTGASTITVTVSDGTSAASDSFLLMVNTVNTAPTISGPTDQTINEDTPLGPLAVTIGDAESNAASLTLQRSSSNQTLVPDANIVLGGSGSNRTVTITPAGNQNGTATIRLVVSDGQLSTTNSFLLTVTPVNDAPVISSIANQTIDQDTSTGPLSFTIGDVETAAGSLTLTGNSSNPTLVPGGNIVFGGSGSSRTVTVTPVAGQVGNTTITLTVDDGSLSNSTAFVVTVTASNTPPTISAVADQTINEDTSTALLAFTVGDADTAAGSLVVTATSSTLSVIPASGISLGGSGSNRTVQLTPATNQNGTATITLSVSDGRFSTSNSFLVTVTPVNDVPVISSISDRSVSSGTSTGPISFIIGDVETAAASLTLQGSSSSQTLVPDGNIAFGGVASNRTVTVTPAANQSGSATITVTVTDGQTNSATSFVLTVSSFFVGTARFTNAAPITIPETGSASTYPSTISVSNMGGLVTNVTLTLRNITHSWPDDLDMIFTGPGGQNVIIFSDAGGGRGLVNVSVGLSDSASGLLPDTGQIGATSYRPANYGGGDTFPAPAPAGPYFTNLAAFNGFSANGVWSLFIVDDGKGDSGSIGAGWILAITTTTSNSGFIITDPPEPLSNGPAPVLSIDSVSPTGEVLLRIDGLPWEKYVIEASEDLIIWKEIGTIADEGGLCWFEDDVSAEDTRRFYRVVYTP